MVTRLSETALKNILSGRTKESFKCVIKFYSNKCHLCHEFKSDYLKIANMFHDDVHFFAFNTFESDDLDSLININGVPSIAFVDVKSRPKVSVLADPQEPSEKTWYYVDDVVNFIEENLNE